MCLKDIIKATKNDIERLFTITDEDISQNAFEQIKKMKRFLPRKIFEYEKKSKELIFMAGSPGAGKSEFATRLKESLKIDVINTDDVRKLCDGYSGKNAHLFQKASSKGVSILVDYAFKHNISFILDGNFSDYKIQKSNIDRAKKKGYDIKIFFCYRSLKFAKQYTVHREEREGRVVPDTIFESKSIGSAETVKQFFGDVRVDFFDIENGEIYQNISKKHFCEKTNTFFDYF
ncbi:zeta toxin family protein [Sulfurimonas sp. NW7]|uniref:zeta toxin family protein n=1 Tax=Sulfurimonas sp. NW7 TaxID=2922727 RepID=UPI003DA8147C